MTTPPADRLIFEGDRLLRVWRNYSGAFKLVSSNSPNRDCRKLLEIAIESWLQLKAQPLNQTPKQHLAAIRADRRARARWQKPRVKNPATFVSYN